MEVTYMLLVSVVAYVLGAVERLFMETMSDRFIPIQNVIVGLISGIVCYFADIESNFSILFSVSFSSTTIASSGTFVFL